MSEKGYITALQPGTRPTACTPATIVLLLSGVDVVSSSTVCFCRLLLSFQQSIYGTCQCQPIQLNRRTIRVPNPPLALPSSITRCCLPPLSQAATGGRLC